MDKHIELKGVRVNNLKNISLNIPRNKFIAIAGVSGSGKSSLAFDTLYAEGQRRYVESLSSYARQFLGNMSKPECDFIKGLPPAIAIEQKVNTRNPRSTVGTSTEIYEYMRLLFARIGKTFSPISGQEVKKHSVEDVIQCTKQYSNGTKFVVLAPIHVPEGRTFEKQLNMFVQEGYARLWHKGDFVRIDDLTENEDNMKAANAQDYFLLIDRLAVDDSKEHLSRLTDSVETAMYEGQGECRLVFLPSNITYEFSSRFEADGITFEEPSDNMLALRKVLLSQILRSAFMMDVCNAGMATRWAYGKMSFVGVPLKTIFPSLNLTSNFQERRKICFGMVFLLKKEAMRMSKFVLTPSFSWCAKASIRYNIA